MKQSELLNLSIEELKTKTREELEQIAFKYTKVLNQKLRRLEQSGVADFSSAYNSIKQQGNTRNARVQLPTPSKTGSRTSAKLINHIKDIQDKLKNDKSLSIRETKRIYDKNLKEHFGDIKTADKTAINSFWDLYGKMKELYPNLWYQADVKSEQILAMAMEYFDSAENPNVVDMAKYVQSKSFDIQMQISSEYDDFIEMESTPNFVEVDEQYDLWDL